jgi:hypothetical protein
MALRRMYLFHSFSSGIEVAITLVGDSDRTS